MSTITVHAAAAAEPQEGAVVPMFVCAGCRPQPLGYAMIELGDGLEELAVCPLREACTWHAAHDLGGRTAFNEQPEGAVLPPRFQVNPYFSCPNFHEYAKFLEGSAVTPAAPTLPREPATARTAGASGSRAST